MSSNTIALIEMLRLLNERPFTRIRLAEEAGLTRGTVERYIRRLHAKRLVRIANWSKNRVFGMWIPMYEWNQDRLPDEPKPDRLTVAQRSERYRQKKRTTGWIKPAAPNP